MGRSCQLSQDKRIISQKYNCLMVIESVSMNLLTKSPVDKSGVGSGLSEPSHDLSDDGSEGAHTHSLLGTPHTHVSLHGNRSNIVIDLATYPAK